jgi:hypothetical protein
MMKVFALAAWEGAWLTHAARVDCEDRYHDTPGFAAYGKRPNGVSLSVGRFCMYVLRSLAGWFNAEVTRMTLDSAAGVERPGVCCFGRSPASPHRL